MIASQTNCPLLIGLELKEVTTDPVVVEVVVVPPVTTSVPVPALLESFLTVQVTEGVEEPLRTATISTIS